MQHDTAHNYGGSNRVNVEKNTVAQKPQIQRKCWICSSPSHLQSACPKKTASGVKADSSGVRSTRVNACSIEVGDDRRRVSPTCNAPREGDDDETTLMKVQVSRCVVEVPSPTDECDVGAYARDCPTTLCVGESKVMLKHTPVSVAFRDSDEFSAETKPSQTFVACPSALTYVTLLIEGKGPYKCLSDSGSEMPIARRAILPGLNPNLQSNGQVKLQGIFGDPVLADLMTLRVRVPCNDVGTEYDELPIVFAITDEIVQNCDFIIPANVVQLL